MVVYEDIGGGMVKAYSDKGFLIHGGMPEGDYDVAIDPAEMNRTYTETSIPIEQEDAAEDEYAEAGRILMGVEE